MNAVKHNSGELALFYGTLGGYQQKWIFDSGATKNFIRRDECSRLGIRPSKATQPVRVKHSSGEVEVATHMIKGVRLGMGVGWGTLIDAYVVDKLPAVGLVLGLDYMYPRALSMGFTPNREVEVSLTLGQKRISVQPGPNEVYDKASKRHVRSAENLLSITEAEEAYLCFVTGTDEGMLLETLPVGMAAETPPGGNAAFQARLDHMRAEVKHALDDKEQQALAKLLDEFKEIFQDQDYKNGAARKVDERYGVHYIPFVDGAELPRKIRRGNLSDEKIQILIEYIKELVAKGYVEPSDSPLASPVLLVRKPNGQWRFTVDYRAVNNITKDDQYMPPKPASIYPQMKGAKLFARMDARDGFWGIPMASTDKWKTAFQTPIGLYHWTVMPMGLKGSPARYQRYMDTVLAPYIGKFCAVFVDDIIVWADSTEQMLNRLRQVFERLLEFNVKLKPSKCEFFLKTCRFLGHMVSEEGISADKDKIQVLTDMPTPEKIQDVRSLLGVIGFLRPFVPHIHELVAPLQQLLRKGVKFSWTPEHQVCKDSIVDALLSAPVLAFPDAQKEKAIMTDASDHGMGATLLQRENDDCWHPIAYMSKGHTPMQARQSPTVKEFFAMYEAVQKWNHELANQTAVTIFSDHKPLEALRKQPNLPNIIMRRLDELLALDLKVQYTPAAEVGIADWLSRGPHHRAALRAAEALRVARNEPLHPLLDASLNVLCSVVIEGMEEQIRAAQHNDERCQKIRDADHTDDDWKNRYKLHNELVWSIANGSMRLIIPQSAEEIKTQLMHASHDGPWAGHLGPRKTLQRLLRYCTWQGIRKDVYAYCKACNTCQRTKPTQHSAQGERWPLFIPVRKWSWVSLDFVTGLPTSPEGNDAVLVVVCKLTKRVRYLPCKKTITAEETALLYYREIFKHHGFPLRLVSDRDSKFTADIWKELWRLTGTTLLMSTADHPQTDGQSEGQIRILEQVLRAYTDTLATDWETYLPSLEFAVNDSEVRTTGQTPFLLEYGQDPVTPLTFMLGHQGSSAQSVQKMRETLRLARQLLIQVTEAEAAAENKKRRTHRFQVGDYAYIKMHRDVRRHKLTDVWEGPYEVTEVTPNHCTLRMGGRRHRKISVSKLRRHLQGRTAVGAKIDEHRFDHAEDGSIDILYRTAGRWYSLEDLVVEYRAWALVQQYHGRVEAIDHEVGQLIRKQFEGRWFLGRVSFFDGDPAERKCYQIVYEDGDHDALTAAEVRKLTYKLR